MTASGTFGWPAAVFAALAWAAAWAPAAAAELVPHRADYTIRLAEARSGGSFTAVSGTMSMSQERTCEGWIVAQDLRMEVDTVDGMVIAQKLRYAAWESVDGRAYQFASRGVIGSNREEFKGRAWIEDTGGGTATFSLPESRTIPLPRDTAFPLAHTSWLIDQARAGARLAPRVLFDGISGEGPRKVSTFIGPPIEAGAAAGGKVSGPLVERPGWKMRLAFYPLGSSAAEPEYEVEAEILDNGVAPLMVLDYRAFTVILELARVEAIAPPVC